jgi:hypothetical protein
MTMSTDIIAGIERFRVEVSGCDEEEVFFVEKSQLAWDEFAGNHVSLRRMLPEGPLVFVRVLQPTAVRPSPPIATKWNSSVAIRKAYTSSGSTPFNHVTVTNLPP